MAAKNRLTKNTVAHPLRSENAPARGPRWMGTLGGSRLGSFVYGLLYLSNCYLPPWQSRGSPADARSLPSPGRRSGDRSFDT